MKPWILWCLDRHFGVWAGHGAAPSCLQWHLNPMLTRLLHDSGPSEMLATALVCGSARGILLGSSWLMALMEFLIVSSTSRGGRTVPSPANCLPLLSGLAEVTDHICQSLRLRHF